MHSVPIEYHWNERNFHYLFSYILTIHFFDKCFLYVHTNMFFQNDHVIPHKCSFSIDCLKCLYRIVGFLLVDLWNLFTWLLIASSVVKICKYISWDLDVCKNAMLMNHFTYWMASTEVALKRYFQFVRNFVFWQRSTHILVAYVTLKLNILLIIIVIHIMTLILTYKIERCWRKFSIWVKSLPSSFPSHSWQGVPPSSFLSHSW